MRVLKSLGSPDPEEGGQSLSIEEFGSNVAPREALDQQTELELPPKYHPNQGIPKARCFRLEWKAPNKGRSETADS